MNQEKIVKQWFVDSRTGNSLTGVIFGILIHKYLPNYSLLALVIVGLAVYWFAEEELWERQWAGHFQKNGEEVQQNQ